MKVLHASALAVSFFLVCPSMAAERPAKFAKPEQAVSWLYHDFGMSSLMETGGVGSSIESQPKTVLARYFAPAMVTQLLRDQALKQKTGEITALDFDLLFGNQDPSGTNRIRIERIAQTNNVRVTYDDRGQRDAMKMEFKTALVNKGWLISDVVYQAPSESALSLLTLLSKQK